MIIDGGVGRKKTGVGAAAAGRGSQRKPKVMRVVETNVLSRDSAAPSERTRS